MNLEPYMVNAERRLAEVEQAMASFDFAATGPDPKAYEKLTREYQHLTRLVDLWRQRARASRELDENRRLLGGEKDAEFAQVVQEDTARLEAALVDLDRRIKLRILPPDPNEGRNLIIEIRPAAGGDEACLFASELLRMYTRFAERQGWRTELLERSETDLGGTKDVAFSLQNPDAYRYMRYESGVHRVQRVPVTEAAGRIHTSTVTVAVLPEAEEVEVEVRTEDLRIDVYRSSGPGGQCVNRTDSAVRITHLPSGLVVASQQEKSQHRNRDIAMRILRSRLLERRQAEEAAKSAADRRQQVGTGDRSERIRTYNFPQNRVTDHRYEITRYDLPKVIDGDLSGLLDEIVAIDVERRLEAELR